MHAIEDPESTHLCFALSVDPVMAAFGFAVRSAAQKLVLPEVGTTDMKKPEVACGLQAAGCADGLIKLWDIPGRRSLRKLVGHTGKRTNLASLCIHISYRVVMLLYV